MWRHSTEIEHCFIYCSSSSFQSSYSRTSKLPNKKEPMTCLLLKFCRITPQNIYDRLDLCLISHFRNQEPHPVPDYIDYLSKDFYPKTPIGQGYAFLIPSPKPHGLASLFLVSTHPWGPSLFIYSPLAKPSSVLMTLYHWEFCSPQLILPSKTCSQSQSQSQTPPWLSTSCFLIEVAPDPYRGSFTSYKPFPQSHVEQEVHCFALPHT